MKGAYIIFFVVLLSNFVGVNWQIDNTTTLNVEEYGAKSVGRVFCGMASPTIVKRFVHESLRGGTTRMRGMTISPADGESVYDNETLKLAVSWNDNLSTVDVGIRYSFDYNNWTQWETASYDNSTNEYYIIVAEPEWKNHIGGSLYWGINRTLDNGSSIIYGNYTVKLYDDDPDPPVVRSGVDLLEAISGGDGVPESDEEVYLEFSVYDQSGIKNATVEYYIGDINGSVEAYIVNSSDNLYYLRSYTFGPLPAGDLEIVIRVWDDDYDGWLGDRLSTTWNSTVEGVFFTIEKEKIYLNMYPSEINVNYSSQCLFSVEVSRNDGGMSLDGLTVYLNITRNGEHIYFTSNNTTNGVTGFLISPRNIGLEPGQYDVEVFYNGSEYFMYVSNKTWLHVWIDTMIEVLVNDTLYYGQHIIIEVKLWQLDDVNTSLANRLVEVYGNFSGDELTKIGENFTDSNGIARIYWTVNVSPGTIKILAKYSGAVHYYPSETFKVVSVCKSNLDILPFNTSFVFVYSDWGTIRAYVYDEFGNVVSGVLITLYIYVDGEQMYIAQNTSHNGILIYNFESVDGFIFPSSIMPGNYTCILMFSGDVNYYQHSSTFKLIIEKEVMTSVVIEVNRTQDISIEWGDKARVIVYLDDNDDNPVLNSNVTIYFIIDNKTVSVGRYEVVDGLVLVDVDIVYDVGSIIIVNVSIDTVAYIINCSFSVAKIKVVAEKGFVESETVGYDDVLKIKYGNNTDIFFTIIDNDGNVPRGNYTVHVLVEGLNTNITMNVTVSNGVLVLSYPFDISLLPGMYTICIIGMETNKYVLLSTYRFYLEIEKLNTYSNIVYYNITYSDIGVIRVLLFDELNNTISGSRVVIYIEDIFVENVTSENGIAEFYFEVNLKPGTYTLTVNWGGTKIYYGGNTTCIILINKESLKIDIKVSGEVILWGNAYIEINITDDEGNPVGPVKVLVYVENELIFNGTYTESLRIRWSPFKEGINLIKVVVLGNEYYYDVYSEKEVSVAKGTQSGSRLYIFVSIGIGISMIIGLLLFNFIKKRIKRKHR